MIRSILAIVAGFLIGGIVVALIELPGMFLHPLPPGIDPKDQAAMQAHYARAPTSALICVGIAWAAGPLVGSFLACWIARRALLVHGLVIGIIFLAADLAMISSFPHPAWLAIVGVIAPIAMCLAGSWLASRALKPPPVGPKPYDMREKKMAC
jgi:hypothetical protein